VLLFEEAIHILEICLRCKHTRKRCRIYDIHALAYAGGKREILSHNSYAILTSSACSNRDDSVSEFGRMMWLYASPVDENVASSTPVILAPTNGPQAHRGPSAVCHVRNKQVLYVCMDVQPKTGLN
jgi:hypothetical protein